MVEFGSNVKTKKQKIAWLSADVQSETSVEGKRKALIQMIGELAKGTVYEIDVDEAIESYFNVLDLESGFIPDVEYEKEKNK